MNVKAVLIGSALFFLIGAVLGLPFFVWAGIALLVVGLFAALFRASENEANRRRCPHCREWMRKEASVCPHCQREVDPVAGQAKAG